MSKVTLKGFITVPQDELDSIIPELKTHIAMTHKEPGCLIFEVTQSISDPLRFDVYEEYVDKPAFEFHQQRVKNSHWGKVSSNIKRNYQISE